MPIFEDTCFKFICTSSNNQDSTVSLRCAFDHVFDKVSVFWYIGAGYIILVGLQFPQGEVSGDTMLTYSSISGDSSNFLMVLLLIPPHL